MGWIKKQKSNARKKERTETERSNECSSTDVDRSNQQQMVKHHALQRQHWHVCPQAKQVPQGTHSILQSARRRIRRTPNLAVDVLAVADVAQIRDRLNLLERKVHVLARVTRRNAEARAREQQRRRRVSDGKEHEKEPGM